jgi:hypothetical protein
MLQLGDILFFKAQWRRNARKVAWGSNFWIKDLRVGERPATRCRLLIQFERSIPYAPPLSASSAILPQASVGRSRAYVHRRTDVGGRMLPRISVLPLTDALLGLSPTTGCISGRRYPCLCGP